MEPLGCVQYLINMSCDSLFHNGVHLRSDDPVWSCNKKGQAVSCQYSLNGYSASRDLRKSMLGGEDGGEQQENRRETLSLRMIELKQR